MHGRLLKLALTLALLGAAAPAWAAIKYVHPSGGTNWANASNSNQPATMATANTNASAGDTILCYGGTYTTAPNPSNQGTGYAAMITYRGFAGNYDSVYINTTGTMRCSDAFVRIECMTFGSTFWDDALSNCNGSIYVDDDYRHGLTRIVVDSVVFQTGLIFYGNNNKFTNCKIRAGGSNQGFALRNYNFAGNWCADGSDTMYTSYSMSVGDTTGRNYRYCAFDTLSSCSLSVTGAQTDADVKAIDLRYVYGLVWQDNIAAVIPAATDSAATNAQFSFAFYNVGFSNFTRSKFETSSERKNGVSASSYGFLFRDGHEQNTWTQCTLSVVNRKSLAYFFGHGSGTCDRRAQNNVFDRCLFRSARAASGGQSILGSIGSGGAYSGFAYSRITGCVFVDSLIPLNDNTNGLSNPGHTAYPNYPNYGHTRQPTTVRNNTFIIYGGTNAVGFEVPDTTNKDVSTRVRFYNNIIYAPNSTTAMTWSLGRVPPGAWYPTVVDTVDHNLYWTGSTAENPISWRDASATNNESAPNQAGTWRDTYGNDTNSKEISPLFADSSWSAFWSGNVALATGSAAIDAGINGGEENIGAWNLDAEDSTDPTVSLTVPDGGQSWNEGQGRTITWTASDNIGVTAIGLWYSTNGGTNWTSIAQGETNDGAYLWTVPNVERESNNMRIRVWATDAAGNDASDSSSTSFTVLDSLRPNKVRNLWASRVEWTAVKLQWTGVAGCTTTVLKYDTTPLTESGANNFRAHGTSVSTGTPAAAGALDSATVTGLTPGTRYYFALRHIDNDGVTPETSLVSIGEVRTTRPAISKGLRAKSTRSYPLLGLRLGAWWESDVSATWPRSEAGWPLYGDSSGVLDTDVLRDSMASAIYGYHLTRNLLGYGTVKRARVGTSYEPTGLGIPDSAFKARVPDLISIAGTPGFAFSSYKQHGPGTDTSGFAPDDPWVWGEMHNWASRTQDTTGSDRFGGVVYPERLYLWSKKQNAGATATNDTCAWGSWYLDGDGECAGMGQNLVYRWNMLSRDTTTGDYDVLEHLADWNVYRNLKHVRYVSDTSKYYRDGYWNDYGGSAIDTRFISGADSVDIARSGFAGIINNYAWDFRSRWEQAVHEFYARSAYYRDLYRPDYKMHHANLGNGDVLTTSDWGVMDAMENDYTGAKGTGGKVGLLSNIYGRRYTAAPGTEPSFATISATRPTTGSDVVFFPWRLIDSCAASQTGYYAQTASRGALGMAYSAMYDDFFPTFEFASETVGEMADPGTPDSCGVVGNVYLSPFYWDESYVNVATGAAVGWGAWGTGTGKGWLGAPIDDRFGWVLTAAADTNLLTVGTSSVDGSFRTLQGWRPLNGLSFPASDAMGITDTMYVDNGRHPRGTHGTADTILRVRRATIDHANYYGIGFRMNNGYGVALDPSIHHSVRWWCKADTPTFVVVQLRNQVTSNASGQNNDAVVWVDTTWRQYEVQMGRKPSGAAAEMDTAIQVAFYLGDTLGTVYFDDVELYNKPVGVMYRRFANGIVYLNPDTGSVAGDSATVTAWRARSQVINVATAFGDTATYDYRLIDGVNPNRKSLNNGRIFGHGTAALDTIPPGQAKFVIRKPNNYWNTFTAGRREGKGRVDRLIRGRGR